MYSAKPQKKKQYHLRRIEAREQTLWKSVSQDEWLVESIRFVNENQGEGQEQQRGSDTG